MRARGVLWVLLLSLPPLLGGLVGYGRALDPVASLPEETIRQAALRFGVDADLIRAVILAESGGDPTTRSKRGAVGLMQLMPDTALEQARALGEPGNVDLEDPTCNVNLGTFYLARLLIRFRGELPFALAAYNAGPATIGRLLERVRLRDQEAKTTPSSLEIILQSAPDETRHYVRRVLRYRSAFRRRVVGPRNGT